MNIKLANQLCDEGISAAMYKAGFINSKFFTYREIYLWIQAQLKTRSIPKIKAVLEAEEKFKVTERTIWRALTCFTDTDTLTSPTS